MPVLRTRLTGITIEADADHFIEIAEDLLADLEREASARRVTKSLLVRESVEYTLRHRSRRRAASCYDLARDLAGTLKGLPHDLATNPKYMEGFGE